MEVTMVSMFNCEDSIGWSDDKYGNGYSDPNAPKPEPTPEPEPEPASNGEPEVIENPPYEGDEPEVIAESPVQIDYTNQETDSIPPVFDYMGSYEEISMAVFDSYIKLVEDPAYWGRAVDSYKA